MHERTTWLCRVFAPWLLPLRAFTRVQDPVACMGLTFPNRIGLAAGFDKNGHFMQSAALLGFGHVEVGAVTPLPQPGHPRPRLFREKDGALRNRMGFNNDGVDAIAPRLAGPQPLLVGLNLGKGKDTPLEEAFLDYSAVITKTLAHVDYYSLNLSSPNTEGLRTLGSGQGLGELCRRVLDVIGGRRPLAIKVSPDDPDDDLKRLAETAAEAGVHGLIATNTTVKREGVWSEVESVGGLSGKPLRERSPRVVELLRAAIGQSMALIGVGGVDDAQSAVGMREAGADLVQIYTGLVYKGPFLPTRLARALRRT